MSNLKNNQIVVDGDVVDKNFMEHSVQDVESKRMPFIPVTQNDLTLYFHLVPFTPNQSIVVASTEENSTSVPVNQNDIANAVKE